MIEYTVIVNGSCLSEAHDYLTHVCENTFKYQYLIFIKGEQTKPFEDKSDKGYMFKVCCGMYDIKTLIKINDIQVFNNL